MSQKTKTQEMIYGKCVHPECRESFIDSDISTDGVDTKILLHMKRAHGTEATRYIRYFPAKENIPLLSDPQGKAQHKIKNTVMKRLKTEL